MRTASSAHGNRRSQIGMTLVELMIVVVIVGILTAIAYPAYIDYVKRAKRAEAKALLSDVSARLERYYFDNNKYTTTLSDLGFATGQNAESAEKNYIVDQATGIQAVAGNSINTSYLITASINPSVNPGGDPKCGNLTLNSRGEKGVTQTGADVDQCWR